MPLAEAARAAVATKTVRNFILNFGWRYGVRFFCVVVCFVVCRVLAVLRDVQLRKYNANPRLI